MNNKYLCTQIVITPNKRLISSLHGDKIINIFNLENGKLIRNIDNTNPCWPSKISPNSKFIAFFNYENKKLEVFDGENFCNLVLEKSEEDFIDSLSISTKLIAYALSNGTVKILNIKSKEYLPFKNDEKANIITLSRDGKLLITSNDYDLKLWATENAGQVPYRLIRSFKLEKTPKSIKISDSNDVIAIDFADDNIKVFGNL